MLSNRLTSFFAFFFFLFFFFFFFVCLITQSKKKKKKKQWRGTHLFVWANKKTLEERLKDFETSHYSNSTSTVVHTVNEVFVILFYNFCQRITYESTSKILRTMTERNASCSTQDYPVIYLCCVSAKHLVWCKRNVTLNDMESWEIRMEMESEPAQHLN